VRALWGKRASLVARGRYLWMPVLSGFNGDHHQGSATLQGRFYLTRGLGVTALVTWYNRNSNYDLHPSVSADGALFRIGGSYSFGGGR
jgi:membrane associated rhomboid family serine protease